MGWGADVRETDADVLDDIASEVGDVNLLLPTVPDADDSFHFFALTSNCT